MDNFRKLEEIFTKFPGIGPRQARRFVYHILSRPNSMVSEFIKLVSEVRKQTNECSMCHRLFWHQNSSIKISTNAGLCSTCADKNRDGNILVIVARDSDFESIEKSGAYKGLYFILGGTIPILDKEPEKRIHLELLLHHIKNRPDLTEIILSLNTTPDGENTIEIIKDAILKIIDSTKVKITVLGRGLSTGAELEYADSETIRNAIKNRG